MNKEELQLTRLCLDFYQRQCTSDNVFMQVFEIRQQLDRDGQIPFELIPQLKLVLSKTCERYGENYNRAQESKQPAVILSSIRNQMKLVNSILSRI